jgi:hypothetical protein
MRHRTVGRTLALLGVVAGARFLASNATHGPVFPAPCSRPCGSWGSGSLPKKNDPPERFPLDVYHTGVILNRWESHET